MNQFLSVESSTDYNTIIFQLNFTFDNVISDSMSELIEFKIAGEYLHDEVQPDDILIARKLNYLYFIGKGSIQWVPAYNLSDFYLGIQSVNFLIICERLEAKRFPFLKLLLDPSYSGMPVFLRCIFFNTRQEEESLFMELFN